PWEWHPALAERAAEHGMALFSSPFDETAVDFLEESIDPPLHKIASFELNHYPLLRKVARTGKPVAASVGASTGDEITEAVSLLRTEGCPLVVLLQCVSQYPADPKDFHLSSLARLSAKFDVVSGVSDHSSGHVVPVVATTLGARLIEKHLVLDRNDGSIDAGFSMEPSEFREMVDAVHSAHSALGEPKIGLNDRNHPSRRFRRSILVSGSIRKGEKLSTENLRVARPADGLSPARWDEVIGKEAACDMEPGHPLEPGDWVE
ncbi:MAG: pseudaminic acid synthase, partial [Opitutae bacterium]|nr:pseudaminic acid synthase [Opitutae bacterium]